MPYCQHCGTENPIEAKFCKEYRFCFVSALIVVLVLIGCNTKSPTVVPTPTPGCEPTITREWLRSLEATMGQWDDTVTVAGSTARINLGGIIQDMQAIKREVAALEVPCDLAQPVRDTTVEYMQAVIDAYLAFSAQESETSVNAKFQTANEKLDRVSESVKALSSSLP